MNVYLTSTTMSTNLKKQLEQAEVSLQSAKSAGARMETITALEKQVGIIQVQLQQEKESRDITKIIKWSNEILIKRYEQATVYGKNAGDKIAGLNMFNSEGREGDIKDYENALKIIETIENEGRRRQLVYFMSEEEIQEILK